MVARHFFFFGFVFAAGFFVGFEVVFAVALWLMWLVLFDVLWARWWKGSLRAVRGSFESPVQA